MADGFVLGQELAKLVSFGVVNVPEGHYIGGEADFSVIEDRAEASELFLLEKGVEGFEERGDVAIC